MHTYTDKTSLTVDTEHIAKYVQNPWQNNSAFFPNNTSIGSVQRIRQYQLLQNQKKGKINL